MNLQYLCQTCLVSLALGGSSACFAAEPSDASSIRAPAPAHDYPTSARVEYVNECIGRAGGMLAALYQCSCAIDRIADALDYDAFVEQSTFAKYATLPGQGGGIFRDSDYARQMAKNFRALEAAALRRCGVQG
jgi:hypothetical protein